MNQTPALERWETHLRSLADQRVPGPPLGAPAGFLAWIGAHAAPPAPDPPALDDALWWALTAPAIDPFEHVDAAASAALFPQSSSQTIEVWTERELSGLHALWRLAQTRPEQREAAAARARAGARWHVEHTQPDNATNRPWAAGLFLILAREDDDHTARLYAETLIHNCQTTHGVPDALSGLILRDAADMLADHRRTSNPPPEANGLARHD